MRFSFFFLSLFIVSTSSAQKFEWARGFGGTGNSMVNCITSDAAGNVYITGNISGMVDLDPGAGTATVQANGSSAAVVKLDPSGNYLWSVVFGNSSSTVWGNAIQTDAAGNVYVAGPFIGNVDFDPSSATTTLQTSQTGFDAYILVLSSFGGFLKVSQITGPQNKTINSMLLRGNNLYVCGGFSGVVDFDPSITSYTHSATQSSQAFVAKYDVLGNLSWAKPVGCFSEARSIGMDNFGNLYAAGYFFGQGDFDPSTSSTILASAGTSDAFVWKLDNNGDFVWARQIGGVNYQEASSIAVTGAGNIYVAGYFRDFTDFDPGLATYTLQSKTPEATDAFVTAIAQDGSFVWAKGIGGTGQDNAAAVTTDQSGDVYIAGTFESTVDFDPGPFSTTLAATGLDAFVQKYSSIGTPMWVGHINGTGQETGNYLYANTNSDVFVGGTYSVSADIDPTVSTYTTQSPSTMGMYVTKLSEMTLGVKTQDQDQVKIYPVPASGVLNIDNSDGARYSIISSVGSIVKEDLLHSSHEVVPVSELAKGIYFIEVEKNGTRTIGKIVVE